MKLQYRHNNGYTYLFAIDEENEHAEIFYMDGSDDFPVLSDEQEITAYLNKIVSYVDQWSGADDEMDDDKLTDFLAWLESDENDYDVCDAEIEITEKPVDIRAMTNEQLAKTIREADEWDPEALAELCERAGLENEWKESDGDTFESVAYRAAEILGVEI